MATQRNYPSAPSTEKPAAPEALGAGTGTGDEPIAIDGFNQVVEMLMAADPTFRESLLSRIARRDPRLARSLREQIS